MRLLPRSLAAAIGLLIFSAQAHAEVQVYKTRDGVVLLSKKTGQNFILELKGKDIKPVGQDSSPNPMFIIDGQFFQVAVIALKDFKGDPSKPDAENLKKYLDYEKEFFKGHLQNVVSKPEKLTKTREALGWISNAVPLPDAPKRQTNVMLAFVQNSYVVDLGTAIDAGKSPDEARKTLATIARSFVASPKEIKLKFNSDGTYIRE